MNSIFKEDLYRYVGPDYNKFRVRIRGILCTIIGGIKIGNNVLIAPGAFVNFDVPDNSIVLGNPGRIIPRLSSPTRKYIVYNSDDLD